MHLTISIVVKGGIFRSRKTLQETIRIMPDEYVRGIDTGDDSNNSGLCVSIFTSYHRDGKKEGPYLLYFDNVYLEDVHSMQINTE